MRPPIPADHHSVHTVFAFVAGLQAVCFALVYQLSGVAALIVPVALMLAVFGRVPINDMLAGRITKSEQRKRALPRGAAVLALDPVIGA